MHGIGFRFCSYEKFAELGLLGRAENDREGGVTLDVEGPEPQLETLVAWCHQGPQGAQVSTVEVVEIAEPFVPLKNG